MILVVTHQLNLSFILQHQGRFLRNARSTTDALRILRTQAEGLQGIILDERLEGSRLITGYVRSHAPGIQLVSWALAQRNSPFRNVRVEAEAPGKPTDTDPFRYVWDKSLAIGK